MVYLSLSLGWWKEGLILVWLDGIIPIIAYRLLKKKVGKILLLPPDYRLKESFCLLNSHASF